MTADRHALSRTSLGELIAEALGNLYAQRQRSALALLGIMIGAASIVAMLTIGHMAQLETLKLFRHMGVDMLQIHATPTGDTPATIDRHTIEGLAAADPAVVGAAPMALDRAGMVAGAKAADLGLAAVTPNLPRLIHLDLRQGRFFAAPADEASLVAVVGADAAEKLSAPGVPLMIGSQIRIKGYVYTVIGLIEAIPHTALDPTDFDDDVMIPLDGAERVKSPAEPDGALIQLRPGVDVKAASERVAKALSTPGVTIQALSAQEVIRTVNAQKAIHSRLLTAIGGISLLVGGIGVMNVMLMGMMERRGEIGLRAAIGATPRDLQVMFLVEAATLALAGGVAGLVLGLLAAWITAEASGWTFRLPLYVLPLGPGLAAMVGLAFGLYPAVKASRLDPIEALRTE